MKRSIIRNMRPFVGVLACLVACRPVVDEDEDVASSTESTPAAKAAPPSTTRVSESAATPTQALKSVCPTQSNLPSLPYLLSEFYRREQRQRRRVSQTILPSVCPPLPPVKFFTGGNRGNGELKTWSDGAPPSQTILPSNSLPYLLSKFFTGGDRPEELKTTAPVVRSVFGCPFSV